MKKILAILSGLFAMPLAFAHCPLCTIGAAAAGGVATTLGMSTTIIGLFLGAFAISTGFWIARLIKKKVIPHQNYVIVLLSFVTTVLPLLPFLSSYTGLYISWIGEYGLTYPLNTFLLSSIIGGLVIMVAPQMSQQIADWRKGKRIPYQGILVSLFTLTVLGVLFQITGF